MRRFLWVVLLVVVTVEPGTASGPGSTAGRRGGVLRVGVTPVGSLDPAQARSVEQVLVADQLFDSLTAYDPASLEPVPSLATSWEASADQRVWTLRLRGGAVFANGRTITAADVKYSLERVARRGSGSPGAELLQVVTGYGAFRSGGIDLAGVTAPAADVVRIELEEPLSVLPSVLASPVLSVVPREAVEAQSPSSVFSENPLGSGPFKLLARDVRDRVLSLSPAPGTAAALGGIEIIQYDNVRAAYGAFTRGELDWARVPPDEVEDAARRFGDDAFRPYLAELFYGFNATSPKLADVRFREALVRGLDRRAVVAAVYHGTAIPADGIVLAGVPGYQAGACARCAHDPDRARSLLAEAFPPGTGPPPTITLDYDADPTQEALARAVKASLAEVGITVSLRPTASEAYDKLVLSGEQEMFRLGWIAAYPSPDAILSPLFRSGSINNLMGYGNAAVDELLRAARAEADPARRADMYQGAEQAIMDDVPVLPLAQLRLHVVVSKRAKGLVVTSTGSFNASAVTLAGR